MKALLLHYKDFKTIVTGLSTRPKDIVHSDFSSVEQSVQDSIVALITVEKGDTVEKSGSLAEEIIKFSQETKDFNVLVCPFAHLSNNLAAPREALVLLQEISALVQKQCQVSEGHFGSDKEAFLHLYGHPGNARYREF